MVDATTNAVIDDIDIYYSIDDLEINHIGPPNSGVGCLSPQPYGTFFYVLIKKDGYNDERVSGNITEDKSWTIALTPIV